MFKRMIAALLGAAMTASCFGALGVSAAQEEEPLTGASIIDKLVLGDSESEAAHSFKETNTIAGVDDKLEAQYDDENGIHCGGGLGDGLTYRQMQIPPEGESGMIEFTIEADPGQVTYITLRTSGSQFGRGNLLMYGKDGDTSILDAYSGREYSELYAGRYNEGPACYGRYYYATYKLPEGMVPADGKVTLSIWHKGDMDSYGTSTYKEVSQPSAYLYSIYSSTEPYFEPDDDYKGTGKAPEIVKSDNSDKDMTAYEYLQKEVSDMTDKVLSWQVYGEEWEKKKTDENAYFEGAVIRNTPISEADMTGEGDAVSRRYAQNAILHQNWSTMSNLMILANAYIFDFSGDKHNNPEILDRYFALLDFYQRAQDSKGGWCYFSTGEDKGKWLGVSLDGTGERLTGEYWPLMSLGADAMIESYIMLNNYVMNSNNQEIIDDYQSHLNEVIDGDLTGKNDRTRRDFYTDMFGRLRDRMANPLRGVGDFYAPTNRAGTANQDFGYAYNANLCVRLLASDGENTIVYEYAPNSQPEFNETVRETEPEQWQVYNYGTASGDVVFDENGEPSAISSSCDEGKGNLDKTFVYKEICGDFKMHVTLDGFDRTSTDKEYFSLLASDSLDFETANFFELRHFSNNNNILLVSHDSSQEASTTSYWAGDMNNKSVPIDFIIERRGDMIEYWYSVDGGATYEQTSKPRNIIAADAPMYIGAAMTCQSGEVNTV